MQACADVGFRQQQREFFAADPSDDIGRALALAAGPGDQLQRLVAGGVTEAVVDRL